jgi:tRNA U34 2-thiouridine synthase MnmA/TrmU
MKRNIIISSCIDSSVAIYLIEIKYEIVALTTDNVLHSSIMSGDSFSVHLKKISS